MLLYNGEEDKAHLNLDSRLPHAQQAIPILIPWLVVSGISNAAGTAVLVMGYKI